MNRLTRSGARRRIAAMLASGLFCLGAAGPVSGRLLVFAKPDDTPGPAPSMVDVGRKDPEATAMAAMEIQDLAPGASVDLNADAIAFPTALAPTVARILVD